MIITPPRPHFPNTTISVKDGILSTSHGLSSEDYWRKALSLLKITHKKKIICPAMLNVKHDLDIQIYF